MCSPKTLSFVLPLYHKAKAFERSLRHNRPLFSRPGHEVVLVLDEPSEERQVMRIIAEAPGIEFKVIVNDRDHAWRPPCVAYNVGVRHASGEYLALADPESILSVPNYLQFDGSTMYCGAVTYMERDGVRTPWLYTFGILICPRYMFEQVCGFDESRTTYGYDDADLRIRLHRAGLTMVVPQGLDVVHQFHEQDGGRITEGTLPNNEVVLDQPDWGREFGRVAWQGRNAPRIGRRI